MQDLLQLRYQIFIIKEEIHKIKCKDCDCFREYGSVNDNLIKYKYLSYNKNYSNKIDEELEKRFKNTLRRFLLIMISIIFFVIKKRCLFLWVHGLVKFDETSFPKKEEFHSNLNMKDANHMHAERVCENFEIENIAKYYNLYRYLYITFG